MFKDSQQELGSVLLHSCCIWGLSTAGPLLGHHFEVLLKAVPVRYFHVQEKKKSLLWGEFGAAVTQEVVSVL